MSVKRRPRMAPPTIEWHSVSLAYVYGQLSLDAMNEVESKLQSTLQLHCRHVAILRYLSNSESGVWVRFQDPGPQSISTHPSGLLQFLHQQFWGLAQAESGRLQMQALEWLGFLQKIRFVEQVGEDAFTLERCFRITGKGRAALEEAIALMRETERRIFSQVPLDLRARVCKE